MEKVAAVLIAVHAIADFSLQTDGLVQNKNKLRFLMLHAAIHAALSYVALQVWVC